MRSSSFLFINKSIRFFYKKIKNYFPLLQKIKKIFLKKEAKPILFLSFQQASKVLSVRLKIVQFNNIMTAPSVNLLTVNGAKETIEGYQTTLPNIYIAYPKNATIYAATDLISLKNIALYDDFSCDPKYTNKSPMIIGDSNQSLGIKIFNKTKYIHKGIHLIKDHESNYFHWLLDNLPRLSSINGKVDKSIPLIISKGLPSQFMEALEIFNTDKRSIIQIERDTAYLVKNLIYPSQLSKMLDNEFSIPNHREDYKLSDKSIHWIRKHVSLSLKKKIHRKIYISRKSSHYRNIINEEEVRETLTARGFEIFELQNLPFKEQITLFSEAAVIIGQAGAGFANIVFCNPQCKIILLSSHKNVNHYLFGHIASQSGVRDYLSIINDTKLCFFYAQAPFSVDISFLESLLN